MSWRGHWGSKGLRCKWGSIGLRGKGCGLDNLRIVRLGHHRLGDNWLADHWLGDYWLLDNSLDILLNWLDGRLDVLLDNRLLSNLANSHLSLNWVVFNSLLDSLDWNIFHISIILDLRDVLGLVLHSIVVSHISFLWNLNSLAHFFILHNRSLVRDVLNP